MLISSTTLSSWRILQGPVVGLRRWKGRDRAAPRRWTAAPRGLQSSSWSEPPTLPIAERGQTAEWERELAVADVKHVEAQPEKQQKPHEYNHDRPGAPTVRGLLFVEIPRQTYFLIERSTAGTCRSVASVISNSSDGLKPNAEANMLEGKVCWAVLNFVAMSL